MAGKGVNKSSIQNKPYYPDIMKCHVEVWMSPAYSISPIIQAFWDI